MSSRVTFLVALVSMSLAIATCSCGGKSKEEDQPKDESEPAVPNEQSVTIKKPDEKISLKMVRIPGGSFLMGSEDGESDEKPVHRVTISGFEMSATEITQAQYEAVMGTNPSYFKGENLPVERVSWNDAMEFCQKLSERTGQRYDLPTEAEWEYACRAWTTTKYYTGDSDNALARAGWYVVNSGKTTHPGGQKEGNSFGLYDMHGNVWEWCRDWYGAYSSQSQSNPTGPGSGSFRVLRGGGLAIPADSCRAANRPDGSQAAGRYIVGLRVVRR